jgi:hypothetical protein
MRRSSIGRALLVLPAAGLALASGYTPAQATGTPGWRTVATISEPSLSTGLLSVAAAGSKGSWAVGYAGSSNGDTVTPIVESWNGASWRPVTVPTKQLTKLGELPLLDAVATSGPGNIWAFTAFGGWLHSTTDGSTWTAGKLSKTDLVIEASVPAGPDSAWAFGGAQAGQGAAPYAAYHSPTGWKRTRVPGKGAISAASAVSKSNIWAVLGTGPLGFGGKSGGLLHYSAGHWHAVTALPAQLRNSSLDSVLARSDTNVWVGGAVKNSKGGTTEAIGHWNGDRWTVTVLHAAASKAKYHVASMVTDGAGDIWALGACDGSSSCPNGGSASRLWHETPNGSWSGPIVPKLATSASALLDLAPVGRSVWGVGAVRVGKKGANGLIAVWGATP